MAYHRIPFPVRFADRLENVSGELVSIDYFDVLGVHASRGRTLARSDENTPVVIISDRLWRDRFQTYTGAIGTTLAIGEGSFAIVGVAP